MSCGGDLWLGRRRFIRIQLFAVFNDTIEGPRAPAVDSGSESLARRMSAESEWMMIGTPWLGVVSTRETYSAGFPKPCQRGSKAHSIKLAKSHRLQFLSRSFYLPDCYYSRSLLLINRSLLTRVYWARPKAEPRDVAAAAPVEFPSLLTPSPLPSSSLSATESHK